MPPDPSFQLCPWRPHWEHGDQLAMASAHPILKGKRGYDPSTLPVTVGQAHARAGRTAWLALRPLPPLHAQARATPESGLPYVVLGKAAPCGAPPPPIPSRALRDQAGRTPVRCLLLCSPGSWGSPLSPATQVTVQVTQPPRNQHRHLDPWHQGCREASIKVPL